jgi:hypothetical protein
LSTSVTSLAAPTTEMRRPMLILLAGQGVLSEENQRCELSNGDMVDWEGWLWPEFPNVALGNSIKTP